MNNNTSKEDVSGSAKIKVKIGIDTHLRSHRVCRIRGDGKVEPAQKFGREGLIKWVRDQVEAGDEVYTCYEMGPTGFKLHEDLEKAGAKNIVVQPQRLDDRGKGVKTDAKDAHALVTRLDRYVAGNVESFAIVRIQSVEEQIKKAQSRHREHLAKHRRRLSAQGASLLMLVGKNDQKGHDWWKKKNWELIQKEEESGLTEILEVYREMILKFEQKEKEVQERLEQEASETSFVGLGDLTSESLLREVVDWNRFKNRREVVSFAGLCPRQYSSGEKVRMGHLSKHGNPRIRRYLVELAWRVPRWQENYKRLEKFKRLWKEGQGSGQKKKAIVALARDLAIDLWRIFTKQTTPEKMGLRIKTT